MKIPFRRQIKNKIHPPTMVTWSRVIGTIEALPEIYHPFFRQLQAETGDFPYTVFTPSNDIYTRKTPEQVMSLTGGCLLFIELQDKKLTTRAFPLDRISSVEVGAILLFSWLTIQGVTSEGSIQSKTVEFNSVSYPHFIPFIEMARYPSDLEDINKGGLESEKEKFEVLSSTSFKFMNYGRKSLKSDERVAGFVWEPEIREQVFSRLGLPFRRTVSHAHLSILTDKELILVREDELSPLVKGNRYGGIWRFIRHKSLRSIALTETDHGLLNLTVNIEGEPALPILFRKENRLQVEELAGQLEAIIGREAVKVY